MPPVSSMRFWMARNVSSSDRTVRTPLQAMLEGLPQILPPPLTKMLMGLRSGPGVWRPKLLLRIRLFLPERGSGKG